MKAILITFLISYLASLSANKTSDWLKDIKGKKREKRSWPDRFSHR